MKEIIAAAGFVALIVLASYGFARVGEPQAKWLWCEVIGAC